MNVPLNPLSSTPFWLIEHLIFLIIIWSPTFKLWGLSVLTTAFAGGPLTNTAFDINLVLRSKSKLLAVISVFVKSVLEDTLVELESCSTNPSVGSLPFVNSLGTTYLILYVLSSNPRLSSFLRI